jgi:hypothetical protein
MLSSPWRSFVRVDSRDFVKRDTVWLPGKINRVVNSYWDDGTYEHRSDLVAEFEDWTLNPALDDKMFKLVFPPKTLVRDEKTNAAYKSGEIGDPEIAGAVNQARKLDPGVLPEASRSLSTRFDVASSSDPIGRSNWSVSWWLALISAASILILGLVAFRRWARKSSG